MLVTWLDCDTRYILDLESHTMHKPNVILNFHAVAKLLYYCSLLLAINQMVRCGPSGASTTITFTIIFTITYAMLLSISYSSLA